MRFDWSITSKQGLDNFPYRMEDGRDTDIRLEVLWCDTDTGEVRISVRGMEEQVYEGVEDGHLLEVSVFLRLPLRVLDKDGELTADASRIVE